MWFGYMIRVGEGLLGEVIELEVPGVWPRWRPMKQWKKNIEEDLREMKPQKADAMERDNGRVAIKSPKPEAWKKYVKRMK